MTMQATHSGSRALEFHRHYNVIKLNIFDGVI
jgi:hypothetical protein